MLLAISSLSSNFRLDPNDSLMLVADCSVAGAMTTIGKSLSCKARINACRPTASIPSSFVNRRQGLVTSPPEASTTSIGGL